MTSTPITDRRQRRRQETIEEVLDVAAQVMHEQGVAGLSIGEVARRMGIRPPSLYVYFDSKNALYDGLFARGAELILAAMTESTANIVDDRGAEEILLDAARAFVGWAVENPAYTQLLFWRPVPGFTPSADAYAPAIRLVELSHQRLRAMQARGLLRADVPVEELQRDWTILTSGVISQQLSNAPEQSFDEGRYTAALPGLVAMVVHRYAPPPKPARAANSPAKGARRADKR
jgi:AcrR family transcriptional regulator